MKTRENQRGQPMARDQRELSDELRKRGLRLPSLTDYAHLLLSMEAKEDAVLANGYGNFTDPTPGLVFGVESRTAHYRLIPGPEFSPRLYRGQVKDHGSCKPGLYRKDKNGKDLLTDLDRRYWFAKVGELACALASHPALNEVMQTLLEGLQFDLDYGAVAQHYGYPTSFLDFSRDKEVAMFFAMCEWNNEHGEFLPAAPGKAILYTVDLRSAWLADTGPSILPMGGEPFHRPEAQRAFALELGPDDDLEDWPWVTRMEIDRTKEMIQEYWRKFDGGKKLLPDTGFDRHILGLKERGTVWEHAVRMAFKDKADPILSALRAEGRVSDDFEAPTQELVNTAQAEWAERRDEYFNRIKIRGACDHIQTE